MKQTNLTKKDLLVVLACIVFLLANIAAIGPRGRRYAKQALCLSNLRKWGLIFQQFAADNDGYFMAGYMQDSYERNMWMDVLRPYYANNHYLRCCPEATIPGTEISAGPYGMGGTFTAWGVFGYEWGVVTPGDYGSYGINGYVYNPPVTDYRYPPNPLYYNWRTANVASGDKIPLFLDCHWIDGWPNHTDEPPEFEDMPWWEYGTYNSMVRYCINRHEGFVNSTFLDFSARKVGLKELWKLKWHRRYDTCGPYTKCGGVTPDDWPPWLRDFKDY
jgi:hypothetical protein